ncbi:MAG TPA: phosphatase PAP2 family protein [Saprospiraceae bacterium]|nr:phosphatase PAP2 family protein [Saprospiraceae bacterium]
MTQKNRKKAAFLGQTIRENRVYFSTYFILLTVGVFLLSRIPQGDEDLFFVQFRGSIWDDIFKWATKLAEPYFISAALIFLLFINFRKATSLLVTVLIVLATAGLTKLLFRHNRPVLYFDKLNRLHELTPVQGIQLLTGDTSFPSGHTMAAFAFFTLLALQTKSKGLTAALYILLAASVGLSRIYLGQHFLKDVVAGSIIGVLIALITYLLFERLADRPKWNRNLISVFKRKQA